MNLIKFIDTCVIIRDNGSTDVDEYDNPLNIEEIYKGKCRYQQGMQAFMGISVRNSVLFIPNHVEILENDIVDVESDMIRKRGIASTIRYIDLPLTGEKHTRIELTQVKEVSNEGESDNDSDGDQNEGLDDGNLNEGESNGS